VKAVLLIAGVLILVANSSFCQSLHLEEESCVVFVGTCVAVRGQWIGKNIFTDATFEVSRILKGPDLKLVTVRTLGGRVDGPVAVSSRVSGGVKFELGEVSLVKAKVVADGVLLVRSCNERLRIVVDKRSGEEFVVGPEGKRSLADHLQELLFDSAPNVGE